MKEKKMQVIVKRDRQQCLCENCNVHPIEEKFVFQQNKNGYIEDASIATDGMSVPLEELGGN